MRLARAMKPMELDSRDEAILQGDIVLQAYFVIKGRIEAYVHEDGGSRGSWVGVDDDAHPLRQSSFLGVWGPGSLWGLSNIMLGGSSEVRVLHRCIRLSGMRGGIGGPRAVVLEEVLHANVSSKERDRRKAKGTHEVPRNNPSYRFVENGHMLPSLLVLLLFILAASWFRKRRTGTPYYGRFTNLSRLFGSRLDMDHASSMSSASCGVPHCLRLR